MPHISIVRHQEIFDPLVNNPPIHIIGAGATGSRLWLSLVELGLTNITIYDFDSVEHHNLANQIYLRRHVGMKKVDALKEFYTLKTGQQPPETMQFIDTRIGKGSAPLKGLVFLLTDTMASRREIFTHCMAQTAIMIETRMASSYGNVNTVFMHNDEAKLAWLNSLVSDDDAEVSACGSSISVGPTAALIANMAVWAMIHALTETTLVSPAIDVYFKPFLMAS